MVKSRFYFSIVISVITLFLIPLIGRYSYLYACVQTSECIPQNGQTCYCVSGGSCGTGYCIGGSSGTCSCTTGGACTPTGWSACYDCYQWRTCTNDGSLQVSSCDSGNCGGGGNPPSGTPECTVSLIPSSTSVSGLTNVTYTASVVDNGGAVITGVNFTSSATGVATVSPASDTTVSYQTTATGVGFGTTTITANAQANGSTLCTTTATLTMTNWGAWWQVKDGDVSTNGSLTSIIPTSQYFDTIGAGGYPGLPTYGTTSSLSSDTTAVSVNRWIANTTSNQPRLFDYAYFKNLVPADVTFTDASLLATPATPKYGYEWYRATTDLTIGSNLDLTTRKVILLVDNANLNINAKINLTDNSGFFGAFVDGNISVLSTVTGAPTIEGIYLTDGTFNTGSGSTQFHLRGSVAALGGLTLSRNLTNNTTPAEVFEYAPDQILLFPDKFGYRRQKWVEVAP